MLLSTFPQLLMNLPVMIRLQMSIFANICFSMLKKSNLSIITDDAKKNLSFSERIAHFCGKFWSKKFNFCSGARNSPQNCRLAWSFVFSTKPLFHLRFLVSYLQPFTGQAPLKIFKLRFLPILTSYLVQPSVNVKWKNICLIF